MQGDFSRDTFNRKKHFSRVLMQQGRVQLDADWNEQVSILLDFMWNLATDLIGTPGGGPNSGFAITPAGQSFNIGRGHYYVNGILCNSNGDDPTPLTYTTQPYYPAPKPLEANNDYLVYLDVWERHISYIEDDDGYNPGIREVALGGPDTATRAKLVWQVRLKAVSNDKKQKLKEKLDQLEKDLKSLKEEQDKLLEQDKLIFKQPLAETFGEFENIQKQINQLVDELKKVTDLLQIDINELTISTSEDHEAMIQELLKNLNNNISLWNTRFNTSFTLNHGSSGGDNTIKDILSRLNILVTIEQLKGRIESTKKEIEIEKTNIENIIPKQLISAATLMAQARQTSTSTATDPCPVPPDSRYRGMENQLYRVEIHQGNIDEIGNTVAGQLATFKWSRENGSVIFPIDSLAEKMVKLVHLGQDSRLSLQEKDWVEILDDDRVLRGEPGILRQVEKVDPMDLTVWLTAPVNITYEENSLNHPLLRRWDYKNVKESDLTEGAIKITEGWLKLDEGIEVNFAAGGKYRPGDYWLIPARTATGDIEWPRSKDSPEAVPPHGVKHHYAPLAIISVATGGTVTVEADCRRLFSPLGLLTGV